MVCLCNILHGLPFLDAFYFIAIFQNTAEEVVPRLVEVVMNDNNNEVHAAGMKLLVDLAQVDGAFI